ncbi:MAG: hypothetical protein GY854_34565 [Deltaproteobacteria bacterium]|nr:hypothetical protein [Deltaproteobacteria bacterium]
MPLLATYRYSGPLDVNQNRHTVIDDETALWAARMIVGEGGKKCTRNKAAAMLWAVLNRWILHPARRHWPSYLYLMRRFSQPINPRWQKGGDLARKHAGTKHCTPARFRRREQISSLAWDEIPEPIVEVVRAFQAGMLPPPAELVELDRPRISNWASHRGLEQKYPWGITFSRARRKDWFFEDSKLSDGHVVVDFWG